MFSWSHNRFQSQNLKNKEIKLWELQYALLTECHYCDKTVIFYPLFFSEMIVFHDSHDSINFSLQIKTVYKILSRKMRILAFSFFLTWDSSILLNFINYLHHLSLGSSKSTHFNDCPSSEACFLHVTSFFIPKKSKTQKFDFEKSQFLQFRSQQNAIFALNPLIFH